MTLPPQPVIFPPNAVPPGEILKGIKLDTIDLQALLSGAYPGTLWTDTQADQVAMAAVPSGKYRVIQLASAWTNVAGSNIMIGIIRLGIPYYFNLSESREIATINAGAVVYGNVGSHSAIRSIILRPGDILLGEDNMAAGNNVTMSVMYVDVFL